MIAQPRDVLDEFDTNVNFFAVRKLVTQGSWLRSWNLTSESAMMSLPLLIRKLSFSLVLAPVISVRLSDLTFIQLNLILGRAT